MGLLYIALPANATDKRSKQLPQERSVRVVAMIGIMMGLYVLARCAEMAGDSDGGVIVKSFATLAFLGNLLGIVSLLLLSAGSGGAI